MSVVIPFKRPEKGQDKSKSAFPRISTESALVRDFHARVKPPDGVSAIGIDLGTTHSVVSVLSPSATHPESLKYDGKNLVPSAFYFDDESQTELVGQAAMEHAAAHGIEHLVKSTKRFMGTVGNTFQSGSRVYTPEDIAARVLRYLSTHQTLQSQVESFGAIYAVVTVPAHFDDAARQATLAAAQDAKIEVLRVINEPTAAALAYSMLPDVRHLDHEVLAVYDFGGGTFDVSIVEREGLVFNVLASEGDVRLGGDDIDEALADFLLKSVQPPFVARRTTRESQLYKSLRSIAERSKRQFTSQAQVIIDIPDIDGLGASLKIEIERETFFEIAQPLVQRTLELTERAMLAAKKRPSHISRILTVGGSSRLGLVEKMLAAYFPSCAVDSRLEPDLAISWGASVQASIILGLQPETILVDVCSHTLGIGVAEDSHSISENFKAVVKKYGLQDVSSDERIQEQLGDKVFDFNRDLQSMLRVAPIIHRNAPLPARRAEFFSTLYANQTAVQVIVAQGEKETVGENKLIGAFLFELQHPCPSGTRCEIQLTYDVNGMIQVFAKQIGTDNEAIAQFDSRTGEVIGWRKLTAKKDMENETPENESLAIEKTITQVPVMNAVVVRARRALMTLSATHAERERLQTLLNHYSAELSASQNGAQNDDVIDELEMTLAALLDALQST